MHRHGTPTSSISWQNSRELPSAKKAPASHGIQKLCFLQSPIYANGRLHEIRTLLPNRTFSSNICTCRNTNKFPLAKAFLPICQAMNFFLWQTSSKADSHLDGLHRMAPYLLTTRLLRWDCTKVPTTLLTLKFFSHGSIKRQLRRRY